MAECAYSYTYLVSRASHAKKHRGPTPPDMEETPARRHLLVEETIGVEEHLESTVKFEYWILNHYLQGRTGEEA